MQRKFLLAALGVLIWFAVDMHVERLEAANVTFAFTGVVTQVDPAVASQFTAGDSLQGTYTFDNAASDADPGNTGFYQNLYSAAAVSFTSGYAASFNSLGAGASLIVDDEATLDAYNALIPITGPAIGPAILEMLTIVMFDFDAAMLASDDIPSIPPSYALAETHNGVVRFRIEGDAKFVNYNLLSLSLVPEPASITLLTALTVCLATIRAPGRRMAVASRSPG